jgi:hypothetical protein
MLTVENEGIEDLLELCLLILAAIDEQAKNARIENKNNEPKNRHSFLVESEHERSDEGRCE